MGFWIDPTTGNGIYVDKCDPLPWDGTTNGDGGPYPNPDPDCQNGGGGGSSGGRGSLGSSKISSSISSSSSSSASSSSASSSRGSSSRGSSSSNLSFSSSSGSSGSSGGSSGSSGSSSGSSSGCCTPETVSVYWWVFTGTIEFEVSRTEDGGCQYYYYDSGSWTFSLTWDESAPGYPQWYAETNAYYGDSGYGQGTNPCDPTNSSNAYTTFGALSITIPT